MPKAKTPRAAKPTDNPVITMPEASSPTLVKKNSAPSGVKPSSPVPIDLEAQIRQRAYQLYEERGRTPGHEDEDWTKAEREILARYNQQQSA